MDFQSWSNFFQTISSPIDHIIISYNLNFSIVSFFIVVFAFYLASDIAGQTNGERKIQLGDFIFLLGSVSAIGIALWSAQFIMMLSFNILVSISFDRVWLAISVVIALFSSMTTLFLLKSNLRKIYLTLGSIFLGLLLASIHYIEMAAIKENITIHYQPNLFFLSILISVLGSVMSLWIAAKPRLKLFAALLLGATVSLTGYLGLSAAIVTTQSTTSYNLDFFNPELVSINISIGTFLILSMVFVAAILRKIKYYSWQQKNKKFLKEKSSLEMLNAILDARVESRTKALEHSLSHIKATLESTKDGILVVNLDGHRVCYNQKFVTMWNIPSVILENPREEIVLEFLCQQLKDPDQFLKRIHKLYSSPEVDGFDEFEFKDGRVFERHSQPHSLNGEVIGRIWSFRDITDRKNIENKLSFQATHDILTKLPNRALLFDRGFQAISHARRDGSLIAIVFIDIDRFKQINDTLGHNVGDFLLQMTALRLNECIRESDTLARLGGDEFVVILPDIKNEKIVISIVQKILASFSTDFMLEGRKIFTSCSIGISLFPKDASTMSELLKHADSAMYRAKESGRNNFQFYSKEVIAHTLTKMEFANDLQQALKMHEFLLYYQPLVDLKTGVMVGAEALLRWKSAKRGTISPKEFIPLAEQSNLILSIGEWVIQTVANQIKYWQENNCKVAKISVNLSAQQFKHRNIIEVMTRILKETRIDPHYLELELTESIIIENSQEIIAILFELKELGISLTLDDFGAGYSSLSDLKQFPIDKLKIDKSFIENISINPNDTAITSSIITLAKNLQVKVVAEGVETASQADFLRLQQCDEAQGYFFWQPMDAKSFTKLIAQEKVVEQYD